MKELFFAFIFISLFYALLHGGILCFFKPKLFFIKSIFIGFFIAFMFLGFSQMLENIFEFYKGLK